MIPDRAEVRPYKHSDFEQIATAIGIAVKPIADLEAQFEAAALWFRLDRKQVRRITPSKRNEKLNQVAKSPRRLLKSLGIDNPDEAVDGIGDPEILEALVLMGEPDANPRGESDAWWRSSKALLRQPSSPHSCPLGILSNFLGFVQLACLAVLFRRF